MKLTDITTSLELAKELQELGYPQDFSLLVWANNNVIPRKDLSKNGEYFVYSAPTAEELLEWLPNLFSIYRYKDEYECVPEYEGVSSEDTVDTTYFTDKKAVDCLAKMVIYLAKNKIIKFETK